MRMWVGQCVVVLHSCVAVERMQRPEGAGHGAGQDGDGVGAHERYIVR